MAGKSFARSILDWAMSIIDAGDVGNVPIPPPPVPAARTTARPKSILTSLATDRDKLLADTLAAMQYGGTHKRQETIDATVKTLEEFTLMTAIRQNQIIGEAIEAMRPRQDAELLEAMTPKWAMPASRVYDTPIDTGMNHVIQSSEATSPAITEADESTPT